MKREADCVWSTPWAEGYKPGRRYSVKLRERATGKSKRIGGFTAPPGDAGTLRYLWAEGNLSCDCNRQQSWDGTEIDCHGSEGRFELLEFVWADTLYERVKLDVDSWDGDERVQGGP